MKARKANGQFTKTGQALAVKTAPSDLEHDLLVLSSRLAVTRPPVFWADGELDARTNWIDVADDTYDDNYRRVFGDVVVEYDPWAHWPGDRPASHGVVVYEPLDMVLLLWHGGTEAVA